MELRADDVRDIMQEIAKNQGYQQILTLSDCSQYPTFKKIGGEQYAYTLEKLSEAGYLKVTMTMGGILIDDITWDGHQFIANTESQSIWKKTKETLKNIGGNSIPVINQVASGLILAVAKGDIKLN